MNTRRYHPILTTFLIALGMKTQAQTTAPRPQAEVAVVRPSAPGADPGNINITPGRFIVRNVPLLRLINIAYKIKMDHIIGGPAWLTKDGYDITATVQDMSGNNFPLILQTLLEDRFNLKVHPETREGPVYELTIAKGGVKMQPTKEGSCVPFDLSRNRPTPIPGQIRCGMWQIFQPGVRQGIGISLVDGPGVPFQSLTGWLSGVVDRPVLDLTGLTGLFDISLKWTPDEIAAHTAAPGDSAPSAAPEDLGPSIFTAVREQLGLELKSTKGPVPILVIDSVERPSEN
jgi:uncharacterized protein (TIGR03435 family)